MAVTTLEVASAIQRPEQARPKSRSTFPVRVLGIANGVLLAIAVAGVTMPDMIEDLWRMLGIGDSSFMHTLDIREPVYMAFALVWSLAITYMHVDEINESQLTLRSIPPDETIRAFTIEDLIGKFVRAAVLLIPAFGLYFIPRYLHNASTLDHVVFLITFAIEFLVWRFARKE